MIIPRFLIFNFFTKAYLKLFDAFFPLNRRRGLLGVFEDPLPPLVIPDGLMVAQMNARVALNAERQVFSTRKTFVMLFEGKPKYVKCRAAPVSLR